MIPTANELFDLLGLDPLPRVDLIDLRVAQINPAYLTPQEREWMAEAEEKTEGK